MGILRKCCCFVELATGSAIVGWIVMLTSFIYGICCIICLAKHENIFHPMALDYVDLTKTITIHDYSTKFNLLFGALVAANFVMTFSAIILIAGAMQRKLTNIKTFLICYGFYIVIIFSINTCIIFSQSQSKHLVNLIEVGLIFVWQIYWWLCVLSFYQEIKEEDYDEVI